MRLFTALPLPAATRTLVSLQTGGISGARWVPEENLHITLTFIGDVTDDRLEDIVEALHTVHGPPPVVELHGVGHFGSRKVRSIWIGVKKSDRLVSLQERVQRVLANCGIQVEGRRYTPHVTLARFRSARPRDVSGWIETNAAFAAPPFEADRFVLYQSFLGKSGANYVPVAEFPLT